jgi:hypothetical protein
MPQCQFLFSTIFLFQVFTEGNIVGIGRNKSRSSYFADTKTKSKGETEKSREAQHHRVARAHLCPRHHKVWAPRASTDIALLPINCLRCKNPKSIGIHPRKFPQRRHRRAILRDRSLYSGTLPGWGIAPRSHLHRLHRHLHCRC